MPHTYTDNTRGPRLQKVMATAGVASRRDCEALITEGRVYVNGDRVDTLPAWVDPFTDRVEVDGEPITRPRKGSIKHPTAGKHYIMLNKPRRVLSTVADEPGKDRTTVLDLVQLPGRPRLYPVGRLDADSTGMILLTDDGELTQRLTHPSFGITKRYLVAVKGRLTGDDVARLQKGLILADQKRARRVERNSGPPGKSPKKNPKETTKNATEGQPEDSEKSPKKFAGKRASMERVRIVRHETDRLRGDRTTLSVTLTEGQNREIRRLLARLGFNVRKLKRTAIGPLPLKGLASGQWRPLTTPEVQALRRAAKL